MSIPGSASPLLFAGVAADAAAFQIDRSIRLNSADTAYLNFTPSSQGNRRTWTISFWIKKVKNDSNANFYRIWGQAEATHLYFYQDNLHFDISSTTAGSAIGRRWTNQVFRDNSAWQHVVAMCDTTASTASERLRLYINGVEVTSFSNTTNPSQDADTSVNTTNVHTIGYRTSAQNSAGGALDAYLAEIHFVDGTALAASDFGQYDDNNVWQPKAYSGSYGTNGFNLKFADNSSNAALGTDSSGNSNTWTVNNLVAEAGLETAAQGFDVVTYTGNGSTQSISSLAFQPDFVWVKRRNSASDHQLYDSVRGANKGLSTNLTGAEWTYSGGLSSFDSTGFSVGSLGGLNGSGDTHVAWCWKAGGTAVSNTDGSITSSVSANTTYGFSIVSYTGNGSDATIGHGLSSAPKWIIKKFRSATSSWDVYHESVGAGKRLVLNTTSTEVSTSSYQNVNSSTFDVHAGNNDNNATMIAYCWSEIAGFSKFGEYSGGCTSSVTVTTGFKPKFVIIKGKDVDSSPTGYRGWGMYQEPATSQQLMAHCSGEEGVRGNCDTGSNKRDIQANVVFNNDGFTVDSCWFEQNDNTSGTKYVYMAFADKPPGEIIDSLIDTPTNYEADSGNNGGNYATLNAVDVNSSLTLSNGNLEFQAPSGSGWKSVRGTIGVSSGKWYWEYKALSNVGVAVFVGISKNSSPVTNHVGQDANGYGLYRLNGNIYNNNSASSYTTGFSLNTIVGVALDLDAGTLVYYYDGVSQGTAVTGLSGEWFPAFSAQSDGNGGLNFGQRPFAYTPPTGYKSLCTTNLPDPTIADGSTAFDAVTYSGNGTTQTITGINHSPDFVWIKCRNDSVGHQLFDQVRGAGKSLLSNTTEAERTNHIYGYLSAFTSDGFTVTAGSSDDFEVNGSTETYVAWNWDGGTSTASNTDGSITSNVRANASAGFSIGTYTGTYTAQPSSLDTVGHGLNAAPGLVITRSRGGSNWHVWHSALDNDEYLRLNSTNAKATLSTGAGGSIATAPTSSVFPTYFLGGSNNGPSDSLVFYCFAPVAGYSAFGSYTGNGSSDGPFVYTGFRPSLVVIKRTDAANDWNVQDHKRTAYNDQQTTSLQWNTSSSESDIGTDYRRDILSNGFKLRNTGTETNASGGTYVYLAFAEHPFKTSRAR